MNQQHRNFKQLGMLVLIALVLSFTQVAQAGEHYPACGNAGNLQLAVANSNANGEDDYIGLEYEGCIYDLTETLVIQADGGKSVTIEGNGAIISGVNKVQVFKVEPGAKLILQNVIVRHGKDEEWGGGGIYNDAGTVTLSNTTFYENYAKHYGGAISNDNDGTITINNSVIRDNISSEALGGGIYNQGTMTVVGSTFSGNAGRIGGGIFNDGLMRLQSASSVINNTASEGGGGINNTGILTITGPALIANNTTNGRGGGIENDYGGILQLFDTTISGNTASGDGGGIYNVRKTVEINTSTIVNNQSLNRNGGGIFNLDILKITNSTLTGNSADYGGSIFNGGISSVLTLTHATIAANSAKTATGGIQNEGSMTIGNTIIANNTGGDCYNNRSITRAGVNLVKDGGCNITGALKVDPLLSPLQGNQTKYFSLLSGSPAIDVASQDICPSADQIRTAARPKDGNGNGSAECDLGSVEAEAVQFRSPTPTNTKTSTPEATLTGSATPLETPDGATSTPIPTGTAGVPSATPTATPLVEGTELLQNGDFEQKDATEEPSLSPWTVKNGSGDKMKCNKPDKVLARTGQCAFQFKGNVGENAKLTQTITSDIITFIPGERLTLNLYINTKNPSVSGKVKLSVKYTDTTLTPDKVSLNLRPTSGYEAFNGEVTLKSGGVAKVKLSISHKSGSGKIYVDSISLRHTEVEPRLLSLP